MGQNCLFRFLEKNSTVILNMLGVEFAKIKNVTSLIYNEGTFFGKKDLQLHSSFKGTQHIKIWRIILA